LYLGGLAFAVLLGHSWARYDKEMLFNFLYAAFVLASLVSVGLQIYQWSASDHASTWVLQLAGSRPYANLGQPNLLGSLLLLGLIGVLWFQSGSKWGGLKNVVAAFFVFGVVLSASRAAWLNLVVVLFFLIILWKKLRQKYLLFFVAWVALFFLFFLYFIP
jgi:O-antigen ligase